MATEADKFKMLVQGEVLPGVTLSDNSASPATFSDAEKEAVTAARGNQEFIASIKERLTNGSDAVKNEYSANKTQFDAYLDSIAQDPQSVKELQAAIAEDPDNDEAVSITVQAIGLSNQLKAVVASHTSNPAEIKDIQDKLFQLQGRAAALKNGNIVNGIINSAQAVALSAYTIATEAAYKFLETIGSVLSGVGDAVSSLFGGNKGMSPAAKEFDRFLDQNRNNNMRTIELKLNERGELVFNENGTVAYEEGKAVSGQQLKKHFGHLHGKNEGMDDPLIKPGRLQIMEVQDVTGAKRNGKELLAVEKVEGAHMKQSLTELEKFKAAKLIEGAENMGEGAMKAASSTIVQNHVFFKAAREQIDETIRLREALNNAKDVETATKALAKAKAKLGATLQNIADKVLGESKDAGISAAAHVEDHAGTPLASTETSKKSAPNPNKSNQTAV